MENDPAEASLRALVAQGATPHDLAEIASARDLSKITTIRVLMSSFGLSLVEAKELTTRSFYDMSLGEYQEKYLLPVFDELEREGFFEEEQSQSRDDAGEERHPRSPCGSGLG